MVSNDQKLKKNQRSGRIRAVQWTRIWPDGGTNAGLGKRLFLTWKHWSMFSHTSHDPHFPPTRWITKPLHPSAAAPTPVSNFSTHCGPPVKEFVHHWSNWGVIKKSTVGSTQLSKVGLVNHMEALWSRRPGGGCCPKGGRGPMAPQVTWLTCSFSPQDDWNWRPESLAPPPPNLLRLLPPHRGADGRFGGRWPPLAWRSWTETSLLLIQWTNHSISFAVLLHFKLIIFSATRWRCGWF